MELTTMIIIWVVVTTVVVVLGYARMTLGLHHILDIHLSGEKPPVNLDDDVRFRRMQTIDRVGIPLTVVSALMALAILLMWAAEQGGMS